MAKFFPYVVACLYFPAFLQLLAPNSTALADITGVLTERTDPARWRERSRPDKPTLKIPARKLTIGTSQRKNLTSKINLNKLTGRNRLPVPSTSCCENGGQCVLRSFCVCPRQYFGRYCEFELGRAGCGDVPHLSWVRQGCSLCYCYDGKLSCLPRAPELCANPTEQSDKRRFADKEIFEVKPDIADDFPHLTSEDYEYDVVSAMTPESSDGTKNTNCLSLVAVTLVCWGL